MRFSSLSISGVSRQSVTPAYYGTFDRKEQVLAPWPHDNARVRLQPLLKKNPGQAQSLPRVRLNAYD